MKNISYIILYMITEPGTPYVEVTHMGLTIIIIIMKRTLLLLMKIVMIMKMT